RERVSRPVHAAPPEDAPLPSIEVIERGHILTILGQTHWVIEGPRGAAQIQGLHSQTSFAVAGQTRLRPNTLAYPSDSKANHNGGARLAG
ncbi:MAG TPA: hypothetical protein VHS97_22450, partial [Isosphaeraceae bacterium]|nr:hypothetical protein [Isosphaeraceae bacterium]